MHQRLTTANCEVPFCDYLTGAERPLPTKFLAPSTWKLDVMQKRFGDRVVLLTPPTFPSDFASARLANHGRIGRHRTAALTLAPPNQVVRLCDLWLRNRIRQSDAALL